MISVRTYAHKHVKGFVIKDNGSGIKKAHLNNIFNPFFTTKKEGSGLGLNIVKKYIDSAGGEISVFSNKKETCFKIEFEND